MYAKVIVNQNHKELSRLFDYEIPTELEKKVKPGVRVVVDFNHRKITAIVLEVSKTSSASTKPVLYLIDEVPILSKTLLSLVEYINNKSHATYQQCFDLVIPNALHTKHKKRIIIKNKEKLKETSINLIKNIVFIENLKNDDDIKHMNKLLNDDLIEIKDEFSIKHLEKTDFLYEKSVNFKPKTLLEQEIYDLLHEPKTRTELKEQGISLSRLNRLESNKAISKKEITQYRKVSHQFLDTSGEVTLTDEQEYAFNRVKENLSKHKRFLLQGVTGSGKTEVYLRLIQEVLKSGKQALVLVPEIALIPQMVERIRNRFDIEIAVVHSGLSNNERFDQWRMINDGVTNIVVGTRSALFMPLNKLGIIIIDEEQDQSYIQKEYPSFDSKDIAVYLSSKSNIPLLLGSATPSIKTSYDERLGKIEKLVLTKRPVGKMPKVHVVDMKDELLNGNFSVFSTLLKDEIENRLKRHEQTMILVNKRGYASFVMCRACSYVPSCPTCQISLSYHKKDNALKCHHCGHEEKMITICPACQSNKIKEVGIGIEQIEEQLKKTFTQARILRIDKDSIKGKHDIDVKLSKFNNQDYDILVGTKMIAKGHDFKEVSLVGVMLADLQLRLPSYLSNEETYNLISQASGRPGRTGNESQVIIQAYESNHFVINAVLNHDYEMYYQEEIKLRTLGKYQPIYQVIKVILKGKDENKTAESLISLRRNLLKNHSQFDILGPTPTYIPFQNGYFTFQLTIKARPTYNLDPIINQIENYYKEKPYLVSIDFYPDMIE